MVVEQYQGPAQYSALCFPSYKHSASQKTVRCGGTGVARGKGRKKASTRARARVNSSVPL